MADPINPTNPPAGAGNPPPPPPPQPQQMGASGAGVQPGVGTPPPPAGAGSPNPPAAGAPPPPPKPVKPANFQLGAKLGPVLKVKVPLHSLKFDEQYFLHLLAGSISLTKDEKSRIVESIPKLKQSQIDELIRIFEEERRKFAELGEEHVPQLEKLAQQHYDDWVDIEMKQEQTAKASQDAAQAEAIRKQLGI